MFVKIENNRKMSPEPGAGAGGDDIILSGDSGNQPASTDSGGKPNSDDPNAIPDNSTPKPPESPESTGTGTGSDDLIEIDENTDKFTTAVLSEKYEDTKDVRLNKSGDIVNLDGEVLIKKEDLDASVEEVKTEHTTKADEYIKNLGTVQVGDEEHDIQEDGSVKDKDGKVLLTKEQLREEILKSDDYLKDPSEYDSIYEEAESITGLKVLDENGEPVEFEDTAEGLAQRDLMLVRQEGSRIANDAINKFFAENNDLLDAFYYKRANGNLNGFGQRTNHEGIEVSKDDDDQQFDIVVEGEVIRGRSQEDAKKYAKLLKDNDMLYEESKKTLSYIQQKETSDKESDRVAYQKEQERIAKENEAYWNDVKSVVSKGKVLDYNIPDNIRVVGDDGVVRYHTKDDFYNYLSKPVDNNLTQAQLDSQNESLELKLFYDYLRFTGNNINYIVDQRVKQSKVKDAKRRFNSGARIPSRKVTVTMPKSKSNNDNIVM